MKWTANTSQFAILDDFLSAEDWAELQKHMEMISYVDVQEGIWQGIWRQDDGRPLRGPQVSYGQYEKSDHKYPTGSPMDALIKSILDQSKELKKQIGEKEKDWVAFTANPMIYSQGSGLYWHRDNAKWTGSWTYYVHREWNIEWGGELLVAHESANGIPENWGAFMAKPRDLQGASAPVAFGAHLNNRDANEAILENGTGTFIMPKPNRLVVIKSGNPHTIAKVRSAAGDRPRMSVSGFFLRRESK